MSINAIVVLDSSDEDEIPSKKQKLEIPEIATKNLVKSIQICEIKSLVAKDIVVIDDEEEQEVVEVKEYDPLDESKFISKTEKITIANKSSTPNEEIQKLNSTTKKVIALNKIEEIKNDDVRKRIELIPVNKEEKINENFLKDELTECKFENLLESSTRVEIQENGVSSTSEEKSNEITQEFETFLNLCTNCECQTKYKELIEKKIPGLKEKYDQAHEKYVKSNYFKTLLLDTISKLKRKPSDVILCFSNIYKELGNQRKRVIVMTDKNKANLEKLQKVLKKINKKIEELRNSDCNWDEESNSEYLMLDRYEKRATLIYKKICSITNDDPYSSRQIFKNLDLSCSKHPEINRAVDKMYLKNKQFPSFYDVDRCVRKCVKRNNLVIGDSVLVNEISKIFKHIGETLKRRRKRETYETINDLVEPTEEIENPELELELDKRHIENEKRIDEVLEKYSMYQKQGKDPSVSSDSDDSNHESNDSSDE